MLSIKRDIYRENIKSFLDKAFKKILETKTKRTLICSHQMIKRSKKEILLTPLISYDPRRFDHSSSLQMHHIRKIGIKSPKFFYDPTPNGA